MNTTALWSQNLPNPEQPFHGRNIQVYRLISFHFLCVALLVSCAGTVNSSSKGSLKDFNPVAVDNFDPVFSAINDSPAKVNELLIVFDIDDTLLTAEQLLGSERWVHWYKKNQMKYELLPCRFDVATMLYEIGTMIPTESDLSDRFNSIKNHQVILLTARSNKQRSVTERELLRNNFRFSKSDRLPSRNDWSMSIQTKNRTIVYKSGLMMVAGTDKGKALAEFLRQNDKSYTEIIFIDDNLKNLSNVYNAFKDSGTKLSTFLFNGINIKKEMSPDEIDKAVEANNWFRDSLQHFFLPRYKYLTSPNPNCFY
jgi:hypothetical protein